MRARSTARAMVSPTTAPIDLSNERVLHGAQHYLVRPKAPQSVQYGVIEACLFLCLAQPLLVGFHVGKVQWVRGAQSAVDQFVTRLQKKLDAIAGADFEVVLAFGANPQIGFEIRLVNRLAAAGALHPQALGADVFCPRVLPIVGARSAPR